MEMGKILLTGGAGFIGSHTAVELLNAGYSLVIVDNLHNSNEKVVETIKSLTGREFEFCKSDIRDKAALKDLFSRHSFESVIHFAGLKAVGESVVKPLEYYDNNICGSLALFEVMREFGVKNIVFSSSATVYGTPEKLPITEDMPLSTTNPYGATKLMIEDILKDWQAAWPELSVSILRYFNPIGAHESGDLGENPRGIPNNLMPYITQVALKKLDHLNVFGDDYPTADGTGVRDYIHVVDLAVGHLKALRGKTDKPGVHIYNLGTGSGYSVLELVKAFEEASGRKIPYKITERRAGDIAACYADATKAQNELGWKAELGVKRMCEDSWRWQSKHPEGY